MKLSELIEKINALRDLRKAIELIKKHPNLQKVAGPGMQLQYEISSDPQNAHINKNNTGGLQHLGIKSTASGVKTHVIGRKGSSDPHYEVDVDMRRGQENPSISVSHVSPEGNILDRSNKLHSDMKGAIQTVASHHSTGEWQQNEQ